MDSNLNHGTRVTISDCGKALDGIHAALTALEAEKKEVMRKIDALKTQGLMISQLVRML